MKKETLKLKMAFNSGGYRIYPNDETSKLLVKLARVKTFSKVDLDLLVKLGYGLDVDNSCLGGLMKNKVEEEKEEVNGDNKPSKKRGRPFGKTKKNIPLNSVKNYEEIEVIDKENLKRETTKILAKKKENSGNVLKSLISRLKNK